MSLNELKLKLNNTTFNNNLGNMKFKNIIGEIKTIHKNVKYTTVIQAASQFNCLEMVSPNVTPEEGIANYIYDSTQGPACALACPAGTI